MRRFAFAATSLVFYSLPALSQSQIQHLPRANEDAASAQAPVPSNDSADHPSTPSPAGAVEVVPSESETSWPVRPASSDVDQLSGHWRLGAAGDYGTFSGNFLSGSPIGKNLGGAWVLSLDLAIGLTRHLELVLAGDYSTSSAGAGCSSCEAKSWATGPMLRYHLVEGTRFSPWLAIGAAYRRSTWSGPEYRGATRSDAIEFLRMSVGGDWFATSKVAFGPNLTLGIGTAPSPPSGTDGEVFALIYAGLRVTLDLPGR